MNTGKAAELGEFAGRMAEDASAGHDGVISSG